MDTSGLVANDVCDTCDALDASIEKPVPAAGNATDTEDAVTNASLSVSGADAAPIAVVVSYYELRESLLGAARALERMGWVVRDWPCLGVKSEIARNVGTPVDSAVEASLVRAVISGGVEHGWVPSSNTSSTTASSKNSRCRPADALIVWCTNIKREALDAVRKASPSTAIVMFNWDDPWNWMMPGQPISELAGAFDSVITTSVEAIQHYLYYGTRRAIFCTPGFDPSTFTALGANVGCVRNHEDALEAYEIAARSDESNAAAKEPLAVPPSFPGFDCDVMFAYTQYYNESPFQIVAREALVRALAEANDIDFRVYGPRHIERSWMPVGCYRGEVSYDILPTAFAAAKLSLCLHNIGNTERYVNERAVLVPGCGATMLVDTIPDIRSHVECHPYPRANTESLCVNSSEPARVVEQIRALLQNPDALRRVGLNGRARMLRNNTWDHWAGVVDAEIRGSPKFLGGSTLPAMPAPSWRPSITPIRK